MQTANFASARVTWIPARSSRSEYASLNPRLSRFTRRLNMKAKKFYKVYGKVAGTKYTFEDHGLLLGTILSYGNACIFAEAMRASYFDVWIDK